MEKKLNEPVLADDYNVFQGYLYVADGKIITSPFTGKVGALKLHGDYKEITRYDAYGRFEQRAIERRKAQNKPLDAKTTREILDEIKNS